jgi:hypothetical protein
MSLVESEQQVLSGDDVRAAARAEPLDPAHLQRWPAWSW